MTDTENPATDGGPREPSTERPTFSNDDPGLKKLLERQFHASAFVLPWDRRDLYERLRIKLVRELKPVGVTEQVLIEQIAGCIWRLKRCYGIETGLAAASSLALGYKDANEQGSELSIPYDLTNFWPSAAENVEGSSPTKSERNVGSGSQPEQVFRPSLMDEAVAFKLSAKGDALARLQQLERHINDEMHRALHELGKLQARRMASCVIPTAALNLSYSDVEEELKRRRAARKSLKPGKRKQTRATRLNQQTK
jgi:hypothetical protein